MALHSTSQKCRQKSLSDSLRELPFQNQEYVNKSQGRWPEGLEGAIAASACPVKWGELAARGPLRVTA